MPAIKMAAVDIRRDDCLTSPLLTSRPMSGSLSSIGPSSSRRPGGDRPNFVMFCVLTSVVLERLAYYSLLGNLSIYLTTVLLWSPSGTVATTLVFTGMTWISCFIGGMLGDAYFGRRNTILVGLIGYFFGFLCLPFISSIVKDHDPYHKGRLTGIDIWFILALLFVSLGEGCFKSNMSPFGADQRPRSTDKMDSFFSYFYWAINIGSFLGYGPAIFLQDRKGFVYGYSVPTGCLLLALMIFSLPMRRHYYSQPPAPNVIKKVYRIIRQAKKNQKKHTQVASPSEHAGSGCYEDFVPIKHWLDRAMVKYGGSHLDIEVEEVKALLKILPVFAFLIVYCICYYQTNSTFIIQGMHMNINVTMAVGKSKPFPVPVAWLALTNIISVLIFLPIISRVLYPCLEKCSIKVSYVARMMIGMFIGSLAMISAGIVELKRKEATGTVKNKISNITVVGNNIPILWQIPQFGLIGISEIFVLMTGLEFAYTQAPRRMQAIVTGLFFIANGLGSMLGSLIVEILSASMEDNFLKPETKPTKNHIGNVRGHLDYFFFGLAVLNFLNLMLFALFCWRRKRKANKEPVQETVDQYIKANLRRSLET